MPDDFGLDDAYPNPFNPSTSIAFELEHSGAVEVRVYSVTGVEVATLANATMPAGDHVVRWDASALPSGPYFYRVTLDGRTLSADGLTFTNFDDFSEVSGSFVLDC